MNATEWPAFSGWDSRLPGCAVFLRRGQGKLARICRRSRIAAPRRNSDARTGDQAQGLRIRQSQDDVDAKSAGCQSCHTATDSATMQISPVRIGCTDCHGGDADRQRSGRHFSSVLRVSRRQAAAHPKPKVLQSGNSANPVRAYTEWLKEDWTTFASSIRAICASPTRPAALAAVTLAEVRKVQTSMMTHGAMLWGAALYNNGAFPLKTPTFGESYGADGTPQRLLTFPPPTPEEISKKGVLPFLDPLQRWEISQPGNVLRVFERAAGKKPEVGNPKPRRGAGQAGDQTERARLRHLSCAPIRSFSDCRRPACSIRCCHFPGTNDQAGDYRASGCTACHVVYANDRSPEHSGAYAAVGNHGTDRHRRSHHSAKNNPDIPSATSSRARFRPASAWSATCTPGRTWSRLISATPGGTTKWMASTCGPPSNAIPAQPSRIRFRRAIPSAPPSAACGRPGLPGENRHVRVQPPTATHPVCRLPQPWLDFPRSIQARSQRQPARSR